MRDEKVLGNVWRDGKKKGKFNVADFSSQIKITKRKEWKSNVTSQRVT